VAYASRLGWANPLIDRLEDQALLPMFGDQPIELGLPDAAFLERRLAADPALAARFARAFPDDPAPVSVRNVTRAIATFERTLFSFDAPYDRYVRGDATALSASAARGLVLFQSERLECFHCHGGFTFSDSVSHAGLPEPERAFHNDGLYDVDGKGAYPERDRGVVEVTGRAGDEGRFKAPTLRNIAVTAPYMHDGSIATLGEVLDHYARGGMGPKKDPLLAGFVLDPEERADVIAFLESLTDDRLLRDPRFGPPGADPSEEE
jgi:cytochrome c peroxidase